MNITIREIKVEDYYEIHLLNLDLGYGYPIEKINGRINHILSETRDMIFLAEENTHVIGYIHISPYELLYEESLLNILGFVVKRDFQGKGIGTLLLQNAEEYGIKHGFKGIRLVSGIDRVIAHHFYASHGFMNRKDQKNFFKRF
jgi:ribosomal protein S18 acetylase RimI-like enzyme